jgi:DNA repair ATPase RecN/histidinol phosphatase-like PHP family hydrolase
MTSVFSEIEKQDGGAGFLRADLHIHSYGPGGSYDVTDTTMTPQGIVDTALTKGIKVISITDHNRVDNCAQAIDYAKDKDILVIPGVELTTNEGHVLLFAKTIEDLRAAIGGHKFSKDGKHCLSTLGQCADSLMECEGFAITAHIDQDKGFEKSIAGYGEPKKVILLHKDVLAYEITTAEAIKWYTKDDDAVERIALSKNDVAKRGFTVADRARVIFSDSHKLEQIGKNISGKERVTRIKMAELSFDALKTAFLDPIARVKIEDTLPESMPRFVGAKFEGGFLDGQIIKFNRNLNCIIGGRGSGKSTLLESIKVSSGNKNGSGNEDRLIDSEVWPDRVTLIYEDEVGNQIEFSRVKNDVAINLTDPADGIATIPIESYGQGETTQAIQDSDSEPSILTEFLDRFISFGSLKEEDESYRSELLTNHGKVKNLEAQLKQLPEYRRLYKDSNAKLEALKKQKVKELVEFEQALAEERSLRAELVDDIKQHKEQLTSTMGEAQSINFDDLVAGKKILAGKVELEDIKKLAGQYTKIAQESSEDFSKKAEAVIADIEKSIGEWKAKESGLVQKIEDKKKELEAQGIKPDLTFISTTAQSVAAYDKKIRQLEAQEIDLKALITRRKELVAARRKVKTQIFAQRLSFSIRINGQLNDTVDYVVKVDYKEGLYSTSLEDYIHEAMGWRTAQVPKAKIIAEGMSCFDFLLAVQKKDKSKLEELKDKIGVKALSQTDIQGIFEIFSVPDAQRDLEELLYEDRPLIKVTKQIVDKEGNPQTIVKDFYKLSLGQQQAIFLTILLHSGKNSPLIIDQPEDDLDSEFIFKAVVTTLRKIKEHRQVIVVTHNANIAVLGDAELILPLRSSNERAVITDRGSIDASRTKEITCTILEGGDKAFGHRKDMYGL